MIRNDYYSIAMDDLLYLQAALNYPRYNQTAMLCQQVSEKLLKSVAELVIAEGTEEFLKTHNLKKIYQGINEYLSDEPLVLDIVELGFLKDFYFEAKYPGENFINVTKEMCIKGLEVMYKVVSEVNKYRDKNGLDIIKYKKYYPGDKIELKHSDYFL